MFILSIILYINDLITDTQLISLFFVSMLEIIHLIDIVKRNRGEMGPEGAPAAIEPLIERIIKLENKVNLLYLDNINRDIEQGKNLKKEREL